MGSGVSGNPGAQKAFQGRGLHTFSPGMGDQRLQESLASRQMAQPSGAALPAGLKGIQETVEKNLSDIQCKLKGIESKVQKA